jgi:hypothetical protein
MYYENKENLFKKVIEDLNTSGIASIKISTLHGLKYEDLLKEIDIIKSAIPSIETFSYKNDEIKFNKV